MDFNLVRTMKVIIAGSRTIHDFNLILEVIEKSGFKDQITEIVSGFAKGVDKLGAWYGEKHGIPVTPFLPDWTSHGKAAGPIRNRQMAEYADALIAVWDGESPGTANMIEEAKKRSLKLYIHNLKEQQND